MAEIAIARIQRVRPHPTSAEQAQGYLDKIAASYDGSAELAKDLARY